jgi:thiol-disulfide isomerase/thioredoxin
VTRVAPKSCVFVLLSLAGLGPGCGDMASTEITPTPETVLAPTARDEAGTAPAAAESEDSTPDPTTAIKPVDLAAAGAPDSADRDDVTLTPVKYDELLARIAEDTGAKLTLVDIWATWCPPCMENFPHVVAMHTKFAGQGLAVASLSFDDTTDPEALKQAEQFLKEKKATFPNYVLDEPQDVAFEKFGMSVIPAVFLFGPDGTELKRYTWDDPNNQFTYDQVERDVAALLQGKPVPSEAGAQPGEAKAGTAKD